MISLPPVATSEPDVERWSSVKVWLFSLFNRTPKSNAAVIDQVSLASDDRFLDVGCGLGAALEQASATGAEVAGVDPSLAMVERASQRVPKAEVKLGSAEEIPFPDDAFTVVVNVSSYHHWADPEAGLAEILRVLAPGGRLLIVERKLKRKTGHGLHEKDAEELAQRLLSQGYASSATDSLKAGRSEYLIVSGRVPE